MMPNDLENGMVIGLSDALALLWGEDDEASTTEEERDRDG